MTVHGLSVAWRPRSRRGRDLGSLCRTAAVAGLEDRDWSIEGSIPPPPLYVRNRSSVRFVGGTVQDDADPWHRPPAWPPGHPVIFGCGPAHSRSHADRTWTERKRTSVDCHSCASVRASPSRTLERTQRATMTSPARLPRRSGRSAPRRSSPRRGRRRAPAAQAPLRSA